MTLHVEPKPCDGILFSLLACLMRDDTPASQLKTINSAWTAMNHVTEANKGLTTAFADALRTAAAAKFSSDAQPRFFPPLSVPSGDAAVRVV